MPFPRWFVHHLTQLMPRVGNHQNQSTPMEPGPSDFEIGSQGCSGLMTANPSILAISQSLWSAQNEMINAGGLLNRQSYRELIASSVDLSRILPCVSMRSPADSK